MRGVCNNPWHMFFEQPLWTISRYGNASALEPRQPKGKTQVKWERGTGSSEDSVPLGILWIMDAVGVVIWWSPVVYQSFQNRVRFPGCFGNSGREPGKIPHFLTIGSFLTPNSTRLHREVVVYWYFAANHDEQRNLHFLNHKVSSPKQSSPGILHLDQFLWKGQLKSHIRATGSLGLPIQPFLVLWPHRFILNQLTQDQPKWPFFIYLIFNSRLFFCL